MARHHGRRSPQRVHGRGIGGPDRWNQRRVIPGFEPACDRIHAAVRLNQLRHNDHWLDKRKIENANLAVSHAISEAQLYVAVGSGERRDSRLPENYFAATLRLQNQKTMYANSLRRRGLRMAPGGNSRLLLRLRKRTVRTTRSGNSYH